jgi:hypothetical protein
MKNRWVHRVLWMPAAVLLAAFAAQPSLARPAAVPVGALSPPPGEEVRLDLSPGVTFEVRDLAAGAVAARLPFLVAIRHAQLAPGKALRISVSLDAAVAPGTRLSFQPGASHGGTCRAGSLLPGASVPVFESAGGVMTGSCELRWNLDSLAGPRRAGSQPLTLHWKLESVAVSGSTARTADHSAGPPERNTFSPGRHVSESPAVEAPRPRADTERPERRRPPA